MGAHEAAKMNIQHEASEAIRTVAYVEQAAQKEPKAMTLITLGILRGLSCYDIAKVTGINRKTVWMRAWRYGLQAYVEQPTRVRMPNAFEVGDLTRTGSASERYATDRREHRHADIEPQIVLRWLRGESSVDISRRFDLNSKIVFKILRENGVHRPEHRR